MIQTSFCHRISRVLFLTMLTSLGFAGMAQGHGPTVKIGHAEMEPPLLNLWVGTTVHFSNTVSNPEGHIVVDEAGTLEGPVLKEPGDGWHYTFEKEGTYEIHLKSHPAAKTQIVVIPKKN